jgi:hypothetical protein
MSRLTVEETMAWIKSGAEWVPEGRTAPEPSVWNQAQQRLVEEGFVRFPLFMGKAGRS